MTDFLRTLQQKLTTKEVTLDLPSSMTNLLNEYLLSGDIEIEPFVSNSVKQYLLSDTKPDIYPINNTVGLILRLPCILVLKLWWKSIRYSCTISQIVTEALIFSIFILLGEMQAQEEYRLELTQEK